MLDGGAGDDAIYGRSGNDSLKGGAGNDYIEGGTGNDTINPGTGNDTMRGDAGNDTYLFDRGFGQDTINNYDTTANRFDKIVFTDIASTEVSIKRDNGNHLVLNVINPQTGANTNDRVTVQWVFDAEGNSGYAIDQIQFSDGISWDKNTIKQKITEGTDITETLIGTNGSDIFTGKKGDDVLIGNLGNDTYQFNRGDGQDIIIDSDNTINNKDTAQLGSAINRDQLWFKQSGNNLEISVIGTGDKMIVQNWYSGTANHLEEIKTTDGQMLIESRVQNLVQAMAAFNPPAMGQTTLSQDYQDALMPTIVANWQNS
jgi:Ca2+-binding RTX toxin-like protein